VYKSFFENNQHDAELEEEEEDGGKKSQDVTAEIANIASLSLAMQELVHPLPGKEDDMEADDEERVDRFESLGDETIHQFKVGTTPPASPSGTPTAFVTDACMYVCRHIQQCKRVDGRTKRQG